MSFNSFSCSTVKYIKENKVELNLYQGFQNWKILNGQLSKTETESRPKADPLRLETGHSPMPMSHPRETHIWIENPHQNCPRTKTVCQLFVIHAICHENAIAAVVCWNWTESIAHNDSLRRWSGKKGLSDGFLGTIFTSDNHTKFAQLIDNVSTAADSSRSRKESRYSNTQMWQFQRKSLKAWQNDAKDWAFFYHVTFM